MVYDTDAEAVLGPLTRGSPCVVGGDERAPQSNGDLLSFLNLTFIFLTEQYMYMF